MLGESYDRYEAAVLLAGREPTDADYAPIGAGSQGLVAVTAGVAGTRYTAYVRAVKDHGAVSTAATRLIHLVSDGSQLVARPNPIDSVTARPLSGGEIEVRWRQVAIDATVPTSEYRIYGDGGSGAIDYLTPLATVASGRTRAVLTGLTAGIRHRLAVRAVSAGGVSDGNTAVAVAIPRSLDPAAIDEITLAQV